jgi:hypothetical protein
MGDEVNLAARLMAVAERDQIIVSGSAQRKVQALFNLIPRGEVHVKGKSDPVTTFQVAGLRATTGPLRGLEGLHSALVGREAEWEQLSTAIQQLRSGRGQIVSIIGEAGLGKSRLAVELRAELQTAEPNPTRSGVRWFESRCVSFYESASYRPMQELIGQMIDLLRQVRGSLEQIARGGGRVALGREVQRVCRIWRTGTAVPMPARKGALPQRRSPAAPDLHRHSHLDRDAGQDRARGLHA